MRDLNAEPLPANSIAIVGMAGRFPGARSVAEFWRNQLVGAEAIQRFTIDELDPADQAVARANSNYVCARSVLETIDLFDAEFFGIYPLEATYMDPQQRLFMESCWEAFEAAGYDPAAYPGLVGVYAGCSIPTYFMSRLCKQPGFIERFTGEYQVGSFPELLGNGLDFFASKIAYKLDLKGPAITVTTACSTSLVAVAQACQALLTYQCDMALAGGASISLPQKRGTLYIEGGMTSPDGHCRTFDADASGTVFGSGVGVALLKRLEDAIEDRDTIHAVIRGFGLNNDGAQKVGYTAPSIEGQARAIAMAQDLADVDPQTIGYVEAHGTGTPLGDPIELAALSKAFGGSGLKAGYCTVGTAKTNVGHLDAAAGITGLIHAACIVREGKLPPTLHFKKPNPNFDMANSPFRVNTELSDWIAEGGRRRAGVSAFGVGGTNAHVVIEEAPRLVGPVSSKAAFILPLSARTPTALDAMCRNLAAHIKENPQTSLADVGWTLQSGRRRFQCARVVVAAGSETAIAALKGYSPERVQSRSAIVPSPKIHFMFPGQGAQHVGMAAGLYRDEAVFRAAFETCAGILEPLIGGRLEGYLYPEDGTAEAVEALKNTAIAQPAIFSLEYALAKLWMSWGIKPSVLIGHSIGEFVAACLADVFSLEDALALVAARGRLMRDVPRGGMLAVGLSEEDVLPRLRGALCIAAINAPRSCVVAGPSEVLAELESELRSDKISCRPLVTSHAFHSAMMDPVIGPFREVVSKVALRAPAVPIISTVTGKLLTPDEATSADYWATHLRQPVRFSAAIAPCRQAGDAVLVEIGPGNTLNTLARLHAARDPDQVVVSSLGGAGASEPDGETILHAVGALWLAGVAPDWRGIAGGEVLHRRRVQLPTYPFERKRYWLDVERSCEQFETETIVRGPGETSAYRSEPQTMASAIITTTSAATTSVCGPRRERIRKALVGVFEDLSGTALASSPEDATFLELGFDSLFLTQATRAVEKETGLKITFRQLLGPLGTFDALAGYADEKLDASAYPAPAITTPTVPVMAPPGPSAATLPTGAGAAGGDPSASAVERLVRDQLQTLNQIFAAQLAAVQGATVTAAPTAPALAGVAQQAAQAAASTGPGVATTPTAPQAIHDVKSHGPYAPIKARAASAMTARQAAKVAQIVADYIGFSSESKRLTEAHRRRLADPRVVSGFQLGWKEMVYPIITKWSQGSKLIDVDGNEYIDLLNGFGPIMFGHRPDFVEQALREQVGEGFEIGPQTPLAGEIAEIFCDMTGNERMTFCNTGSEAVMAAMRVARTVTGRDKIVMFSGDYHGMFDEVLVKPWRAKDGTPGAVPLAPGIPRESVANIVVLDYGTDQALAWIRENASELAAVIVEPVQSRRPDFQPIAFLKDVREITRASGTAFVFDEVVTGFRTHPGGCQALFGIRADMATYGKVLGGGMPIGVLAGRSEFMDALDGGAWQFGDQSCPEVGMTFFAGTFVRHPLALAAVRAVLLKVKEEGPSLQERLADRTAAMVRRINEVLSRLGVPTQVKHFKSFMYFKFAPDERFASLFYFLLRRNGIHIQEGFPCFLTSAHSDADIDKIVAAFETAAREMSEGDLFTLTQPVTDEYKVAGPVLVTAPESVPLTEPQREIFHAAIMGDDVSCAFNESFSIELKGSVNVEALIAAVNGVVQRHEALRGRVDVDGTSLRFSGELVLLPQVHDLDGLAPDVAEAGYRDILHADASKPFDLFNGPLVRLQIVRLPEGRLVLIVTAHHIVCDGWSCGLIANEIAELYSSRIDKREPSLDEPASYARHAIDDVRLRQSTENRAAEQYWLDQYRTPPALPDLPTDQPRGETRTFVGATCVGRISKTVYSQIKARATGKGLSLFQVLLAGYGVLLHRLTGERDLAIGIPLAGQTALENPNLVGHCVNALPLRLECKVTTPVGALLAHAREKLLDAYDHQSFTYGTLVQKLALKRDPARLPLSEVQFNVEQFASALRFSGLEARATANPKAAVNADMFLNVVEHEDGLRLEWDYNRDLYSQATIERWIEAFEQIAVGLTSAGADDRTVGALDVPALATAPRGEDKLASIGDVARIAAWNQTTVAFPHDKSLVDLFEAQVVSAPDAPALVFGDETTNYGSLNARANSIARALIANGVMIGDLVAVCMPRSPDLVAAILAILKAGAAYVPIDPQSPRERIDYMLQDSEAAAVLTQASVGLQCAGTRVVLIDAVASVAASDGETANLPHKPAADDLAYVMYTSGSTGKPKGVMIEHRAAVQLVRDSDIASFGPEETALMSVSVAFDPSLLDILGSLLNGGRLVVMPAEPAVPSLIAKLVKEHGATSLFTTTGVFHVLVEDHLAEISSLRQICVGGEVLSPSHAQKFVDSMPSTTLIAAYGPTEATTISTFTHYRSGDRVPDPVPIGRPMANTRVYVVDEELRQVPIGARGELVIAGVGLARGYLKRPELTAEKFVELEVSPGVRERVYRSGDLVSFAEEGSLQFHGRMDGQIKLRGFRIEIGEIEAALLRQPGVGNACVVPVRDGGRVTQLVGFCTQAEGSTLDVEAVKQGVAASLMAYMVPGSFVALEEFPLNVNGKIDREKLLGLAEERRGQREYIGPATAQEAELARITAEVMKLERVGVTENLFELGLDSLMIFQIASRAAKAGVNVSPRAIMQSRTVRDALLAAAAAPVSIAQVGAKKITRAVRQAVRLQPAAGGDGAAAE